MFFFKFFYKIFVFFKAQFFYYSFKIYIFIIK